jgi:hypothetical protein
MIISMWTHLFIVALLTQNQAPPDPPPLGKLVDIGGYRLRLNRTPQEGLEQAFYT